MFNYLEINNNRNKIFKTQLIKIYNWILNNKFNKNLVELEKIQI